MGREVDTHTRCRDSLMDVCVCVRGADLVVQELGEENSDHWGITMDVALMSKMPSYVDYGEGEEEE